MYASLISAGASALYDLVRSPSTNTSTATPTSGSSFGADLNKFMMDLQSRATSTNATNSVATDLQSAFSDLQKSDAGKTSSASDPFQGLASSLQAYANTQGLASTQTASTSLTA